MKDEIKGATRFTTALCLVNRHPHYVLRMKLDCCNVNTVSYVALVGLEGFEPPTSWFEAMCSDPTELKSHLKYTTECFRQTTEYLVGWG